MSFSVLGGRIIARLKNRNLLRTGSLLMLSNAIGVGLALIRTPAISWLLPKEQIGMLGMLSAWLPFIQLASLSGLDSSSYHYVAKGQTWAFRLNLIHRLRWSLISAGIFGLGGLYWSFQGQSTLAWLFFIAGIFYPVTVGLTVVAGTLAARENFTALFWYRIAETLVDFVGFVPLLLWKQQTQAVIPFYGFNQFSLAALQVGVGWWLLRQVGRIHGESPTPEAEREFVKYGAHQTAISSISVLQSRVDGLLISSFFPLAVIADYSIALWMQGQLKQLWTIYLSIRYPPLVRMPKVHRRRRLILEGVVVLVGFCIIGSALVLVAIWVVPILFPPSYAQALPYLTWLVAIFVAGIPGYFAEVWFRTEQKEMPQYILRGVAALFGVILPLIGMPYWGVSGIFAGRLASDLIFSAFGIWQFFRYST